MFYNLIKNILKNGSASLHCISISELCSAVQDNLISQHQIAAKKLAGCNICNLLHETNEKYENLNSIKSQLHYHHATYYSCSYVVYFIHEYFMKTDLHLQISQHQANLKHENFTLSYHSYTTLLPQNILQLQLHFSCTLCSRGSPRVVRIPPVVREGRSGSTRETSIFSPKPGFTAF